MRLRVVLPTHIEVDEPVRKVNVEAQDGAFCLLPRHVDFAATLVPGLLQYEPEGGSETVLAVGGGTLVKCGDQVLVSTTYAARGSELGRLREAVEERFSQLDERERKAHSAVVKIEADFMRRLIELEEHA